jgi:predicted N-acetyltransferase YhbS
MVRKEYIKAWKRGAAACYGGIYTQAMTAWAHTIREATEADIPALVPLVNHAFELEKFFSGGDRTDADEMRRLMQEATYLVSEDEQGVSGCVMVKINGSAGYFGMLAVDPARQKSGLGGKLITAAEDYARKRGCTVMEITVVNLRTELFPYYRKLGYVDVGPEGRRATKKEPLLDYHLVRMRKML